MNYQKIYDSLIQKRKDYPLLKKDQYCEKHHIKPKSLGGTNDCFNVVNLTAREHYVAHLLLVKIAEKNFGRDSDEYLKMVSSVMYFGTCKSNSKLIQRKDINFNSRNYEKIRQSYAEIQSVRMLGKLVGEKNGMFGKKRTAEEKKKISETRIKSGIAKGERNPMFGRPCYYKMTDEQYESWKVKIKTTCQNKKFKHMYNPNTLENRLIPEDEVQIWFDKGFVIGQHNKKRRSTKGMKKVCLPVKGAKQVWVRPEELQEYLNKGYILWSDRKYK